MSWELQAECRLHPASWWFSDDKATRDRAVKVCAACPVKKPCLEGALEREERYGVWAGRDFGEPARKRQYREAVKLRERRRVA